METYDIFDDFSWWKTAFHSAVAAAFKQTPKCRPDVPGISDRRTGEYL